MPVPTDISQLSQTAGSNSPAGSESPTTADDYFRTYASYIALLRDGKGFSDELDVASAATCDIGNVNSHIVRITGTTGITSLGTTYNGPRFVRFADALTLTHNASTLVLPGAANITTAAGDAMLCVPNGSTPSGWRVLFYQRAATAPITLPLATTSGGTGSNYANAAALFAGIKQAATDSSTGVVELATTAEAQAGTSTSVVLTPANLKSAQIQLGSAASLSSQTSVDVTSIPSWVNRITVGFIGISTNGTDAIIVQIGDVSSLETSGYVGACSFVASSNGLTSTLSSGFMITRAAAAAQVYSGTMIISRIDGNTWACQSIAGESATGSSHWCGGYKTLTNPLGRLRLTTSGGTNQFDLGSVNITYE